MDFESALNSIPATQAAFSEYYWLAPVNKFKEIVDDIKSDSFYVGGASMSSGIDTLNDVNKTLDATQIFYHENNQKEVFQQIISNLEALKKAKAALDSSKIRSDVVRYNDNLEKARSNYYRKYLQELCENYNATNNNIVKIWYEPAELRDIGYNGSNAVRVATVGWWSGGVFQTQSVTGIKTIINKEKDKIDYARFIKSWDTFLDMRNDTMVKELEKRGYQVEKMERPADTK